MTEMKDRNDSHARWRAQKGILKGRGEEHDGKAQKDVVKDHGERSILVT